MNETHKSAQTAQADKKSKGDGVPAWLRLPVQCTILGLLVFFLYVNTTKNRYAVDDLMVIGRNEFTQKGFGGIKDMLTHDSFYGFWGDNKDFANRFYRPLSLITFAMEKGFVGETKPAVSHFINFFIFGCTVLLLAIVINRYFFPTRPLLAFIILLIFAVHPIHTEVVTNVKGRDEGLAFMFLALSLWGLFSYVDKKDYWRLGVGLGAYFLALLSKENGLSFLGVVPLSLWCFSRLKPKEIIVLSSLFVGVFVAYMGVRMSVIGFNLKVEGKSVLDNFYYGRTMQEKYATIFFVLGLYIKLLFWPHPLSWDYSFSQVSYKSFGDPLVILSILIQAALLGWALYKIKDRDVVAYGILFYFGTLFVVSNLVINIGGYIGERFLFQPSLGFAIAIGYGLYWFWKEARFANEGARGALAFCVLGAIVLAGGAKTIARNAEWRDGYTLTLKDVAACPNSAKTNGAAGGQLVEMANVEQDPVAKNALLDQAIPYLTRAVEIYPGFAQAAMELGTAYYLKKDYLTAEKYYKQSEKANPENPVLKINIASLSDELATIANKRGDKEAALKYELRGLSYNPKNANGWSNLGVFYTALGKQDSALAAYRKAVELAPDAENFRYNLGYGYFMAKKYEEARATWNEILKRNPNNKETRSAMGSLPPPTK